MTRLRLSGDAAAPRLRFGLGLLLVVTAAAAAANPARVAGRVIDMATRAAVVDAVVEVGEATVRTGADGRFDLPDAAGTSLRVRASGYLDEQVVIPSAATRATAMVIELIPAGFTSSLEVVAAEHQTESAQMSVEPEKVLQAAGSIDNIFRTLQLLPGVSAPRDFDSRLAVRGGSPDQNLTIMDGVEVHNPYRLFGLTSAFNPETVERFDLTAGGFSARYGDRLSSLLVVDNRRGDSDVRLAASSSLSLTDANLVVEGGAPGSGSWLVSARRTYYDLVAERFVDDQLPAFNDLQAKASWTLPGYLQLSVLGLRSREGADLNFDGDLPEEQGDALASARNDLASVNLLAPLGTRATSRTIVAWYRNDDFVDFDGTFEQISERSNSPAEFPQFTSFAFQRQLRVEDLSVRQELTWEATKSHSFDTGVEVHGLTTELRFKTSGDRNLTEGNGSSVRGGVGLPESLASSLDARRIGAWLEDRVTMTDRLRVDLGLRYDWSEANDRATVTPRVSTRLRLDDATRVRASWGRYSQSPGYEKLIQSDYFIDLSNARALDLHHERAQHAVLGLERDLGAGTALRVEGYYKKFDDLIVGRLETEAERATRLADYDFPAEFATSVPTEPIITSQPTNDGRGRAYGLDLYLERRATSAETRTTGWISYTLGKAERQAYGRWYPFDYDRRHALSVVVNHRFGPRLQLGATANLASGFPRTLPLGLRVSATEDSLDGDGDGNRTELVPAYDPSGLPVYGLDLGGVDNLSGGRLPSYARLDLRLTYRPGGDDSRWDLYLEALNVTNRDNAGAIENELAYDPASTRPAVVEKRSEAFPFLPSFGVRFRF